MRRGLAWLLGLGLGANGFCMLLDPEDWYLRVPGVAGTGPANLHFIRDIGCAYLVVAASLFWLARKPRLAWPAACAGGAFLTLHALVHVWDTLAGRESWPQLWMDAVPVVAPALVVLWLAWAAMREPPEGRS
jgi:hypothetical protein